MRAASDKETTHTERLHYLDWLRVVAVLGVFYAHTTNIYDLLYWHIRGGDQSAGLIPFLTSMTSSRYTILSIKINYT